MNFRKWSDLSLDERKAICREQPADAANSKLYAAIADLMGEVRRGDEGAVKAITERVDGVILTEVVHSVRDLASESDALLTAELKSALDLAIDRSRKYSRLQLELAGEFRDSIDGDAVGQILRPIESLAVFVPAGKGSFPSVLIHVAAPAVEAGVPSIVLLTSPDTKWAENNYIDPAVVYVAAKLGIEKAIVANGPAAVAAATFGISNIEPARMIVGPGSPAIVAAQAIAEREGIVTQGGLGPSDSLIIVEPPISIEVLAADFISEAEHGNESSVVLLSTDEDLLRELIPHVEAQLKELPEERQAYARSAIANGGMFAVSTVSEAVEISNRFAPEHVLLLTSDNERYLDSISNAAIVLLGPSSPFAVASFTAGTPATLPTTGAARMFSGVTALTYMKRIAVLEMRENSLKAMAGAIQAIATHERFPAHAASLSRRY